MSLGDTNKTLVLDIDGVLIPQTSENNINKIINYGKNVIDLIEGKTDINLGLNDAFLKNISIGYRNKSMLILKNVLDSTNADVLVSSMRKIYKLDRTIFEALSNIYGFDDRLIGYTSDCMLDSKFFEILTTLCNIKRENNKETVIIDDVICNDMTEYYGYSRIVQTDPYDGLTLEKGVELYAKLIGYPNEYVISRYPKLYGLDEETPEVKINYEAVNVISEFRNNLISVLEFN